MFGWIRGNRTRRLERAYARKLEQARDVQRNGDIIRYSELMAEAEAILKELDSQTCQDCQG